MTLVRRRPMAGLATLGVVALITGCGGGGSDTLSADEFRTQADAICADYDSQSAALTDPTTPSEYLASLKEILPLQQAQLSKLEALKPPSDLADTYGEALALLKKQVSSITTATSRIESGDDPEAVITEIGTEVGSLSDEADAKAAALGLKVCGSQGSATATDTTATTPTAPAATTAPATTTAPASTTGTAGYVTDVQTAAAALQAFGSVLSDSTGIEDLKAKVPEAQKSLDDFDVAIAKLGGYTIGIAKLDEQRAGLARTGPKVSDVLRRFLDAASTGDLVAVQKLVPEVSSTISEFQAAATGS